MTEHEEKMKAKGYCLPLSNCDCYKGSKDFQEQKPGLNLSTADLNALNLFLSLYPTWWWKIGVCDLTRDFDCAPQAHSPEMKFKGATVGSVWDSGFHCDHTGTVADAIKHVIAEIGNATMLEEALNNG